VRRIAFYQERRKAKMNINDSTFEVFATDQEFVENRIEEIESQLQLSMAIAMDQTYTIERILGTGVAPTFDHLKLACNNVDFRLARMLIAGGARPSLRDIHTIIDDLDLGLIYFMIKSGIPAEVFLADEAVSPLGHTAWSIAEELNDQKTLKVLRAAMDKSSPQTRSEVYF